MRDRSRLACFVAAVLFGASTPAAKLLLDRVEPFTLAGLFYLGAALAMLPLARRGGSAALRRTGRERLMLGGAVLAGGAIGPVALLLALRQSGAASVSLWLNLETVATAFLAWAFFREHLDRITLLAAAAILTGGVLLAVGDPQAGWRAASFVGLACLAWGIDNNLTAAIGGFTPAQTTLAKGLGAGTINLAIGCGIARAVPNATLIVTALLVGVVCYGLSILLYIYGAQRLGASRAQLLFAVAPLSGLLAAWTLLNEPLRAAHVGAIVAMGCGVLLLNRVRHAHEHEHESMEHTHYHRHGTLHHEHTHDDLPADTWHIHPHAHHALTHSHPHDADLHHRHEH
ncbi:MAG: DMT family transporter [Candidatus Eisenbacteria bacterium]